MIPGEREEEAARPGLEVRYRGRTNVREKEKEEGIRAQTTPGILFQISEGKGRLFLVLARSERAELTIIASPDTGGKGKEEPNPRKNIKREKKKHLSLIRREKRKTSPGPKKERGSILVPDGPFKEKKRSLIG